MEPEKNTHEEVRICPLMGNRGEPNIEHGFFASRETLEEAFLFAHGCAERSDNYLQTITPVLVLWNTIVKLNNEGKFKTL